jgi:hypothetical protein
VLRTLSEITTASHLPNQSFMEFSRSRFERELEAVIQNGTVDKEQLEQLTEESTVNGFIEQKRDELEKEFVAMLALDEIYKREKLTVDNSLVMEQAKSALKMAEDAGHKGAHLSVRSTCLLLRHNAFTRCWSQPLRWAGLSYCRSGAHVIVLCMRIVDVDAPGGLALVKDVVRADVVVPHLPCSWSELTDRVQPTKDGHGPRCSCHQMVE